MSSGSAAPPSSSASLEAPVEVEVAMQRAAASVAASAVAAAPPLPALSRALAPPRLHGWSFFRALGSPRRILAPMVDASELPFRLLARQFGAELCYTPMLHARNVVEAPSYASLHFSSCAEDRPLIAQLAGDDPAAVLAAARRLQGRVDAVDLNLGCPQQIARRGHYGSFLLEETALVARIIAALHEGLDVPVTAKVRILPRWEDTLRTILAIQAAGASIITVHGRTRTNMQQFTTAADWEVIRRIKADPDVRVPIFANGGVGCFEDVQACMDATGADGVMVSEAALENPGIFSDRTLTRRFGALTDARSFCAGDDAGAGGGGGAQTPHGARRGSGGGGGGGASFLSSAALGPGGRSGDGVSGAGAFDPATAEGGGGAGGGGSGALKRKASRATAPDAAASHNAAAPSCAAPHGAEFVAPATAELSSFDDSSASSPGAPEARRARIEGSATAGSGGIVSPSSAESLAGAKMTTSLSSSSLGGAIEEAVIPSDAVAAASADSGSASSSSPPVVSAPASGGGGASAMPSSAAAPESSASLGGKGAADAASAAEGAPKRRPAAVYASSFAPHPGHAEPLSLGQRCDVFDMMHEYLRLMHLSCRDRAFAASIDIGQARGHAVKMLYGAVMPHKDFLSRINALISIPALQAFAADAEARVQTPPLASLEESAAILIASDSEAGGGVGGGRAAGDVAKSGSDSSELAASGAAAAVDATPTPSSIVPTSPSPRLHEQHSLSAEYALRLLEWRSARASPTTACAWAHPGYLFDPRVPGRWYMRYRPEAYTTDVRAFFGVSSAAAPAILPSTGRADAAAAASDVPVPSSLAARLVEYKKAKAAEAALAAAAAAAAAAGGGGAPTAAAERRGGSGAVVSVL